MYAKKFEETRFEELHGNRYNILLPMEMTEAMQMALVRVSKGDKVPKHTHPEEEQAYIVLEGQGLLTLGGEQGEVGEGMVVYIPRGTEHEIEGISEEELVYIYVAVWPEGRQEA
ncbi:MAG: cupin domain-containing protein [Anaerolineae bacterium]